MTAPKPQTKDNNPEFSYRDLLKASLYFLRGYKWQFIFFNVLLLIGRAANWIDVYYIGEIINFFTAYEQGQSLDKLYQYIAIIGINGVITGIIYLWANNRLAKIEIKTIYQNKKEALQKLVKFDLGWHQKENSGNKIQKLNKGLNSLEQLLRILRFQLFWYVFSFFFPLVVFAFLDLTFWLFFAVYIGAISTTQLYFMKRQSKIEEEINKENEGISGQLFETASNITTLKTTGADERINNAVFESEEKQNGRKFQLKDFEQVKFSILETIRYTGTVVFFVLISRSLISGAIAIGAIFLYWRLFNTMRMSTSNFLQTMSRLTDIKSSIGRMMSIFKDVPLEYFGTEKLEKNWKKIELRNVDFDYKEKGEGARASLKDINLTIKRGEKIGIVGQSGSGKSTLSKILMGLHKIDEGQISFDKQDFYSLSQKEVTDNLFLVLQETELFNATLRDNITMFQEMSEEKVAKAIESAQLQVVIDKLPEGLDTKVGEKGYKLSGGEKQRVGIARSLCSDAQILIFDEATSALDSKTEQTIQQSLEKSWQNKTVLVIAHRLSTLKNTDRLIIFEKGEIAEQGSFSQLSQDVTSKFHELWKLQSEHK